MSRDAISDLAALVAIDSVSTRSNAEVVEWLERRLAPRGFAFHRHRYVDERGVAKENLVAVAGPAATPLGAGGLAFVGHTDTVPFDPAWKDALRLVERDGRLYGRGAADTKGFIAAVLAAIDRVDLAGLRRPLVCVFTADEELGCIGARRLLEEVELRPACAIVGEPTGLVPVRAHKGYWLAEVEMRGAAGHSAFPALGRSAIRDAARLILRLEAAQEALKAERDPAFDPAWTTLHVGTIEGGEAPNVIPAACRFPLEWRPLPRQPGERVAELLDRAIEELHAADPGFDASWIMVRREPAVEVDADEPIVRFLEEATGTKAAATPFGTELPWLVAAGIPGCVCGPGDIRTAHRTGEYVERAALERAADLFAAAIARFCAQA